MDDGCPKHRFLAIPNVVPFNNSLVGEPECVSLYRSRVNPSKVGTHASAPLSEGVRFGPLLQKDVDSKIASSSGGKSARASSKWMTVSSTGGLRADCELHITGCALQLVS